MTPKAIVPILRSLADCGFQGPALGDLGYRGERLAKAGETLGITVEAIARGRDGRFVPAGICWVVERSFAWLSRYRRLNTIFERSKDHLVAFVAIAFISILARRLKRIAAEDFSARHLQTDTDIPCRAHGHGGNPGPVATTRNEARRRQSPTAPPRARRAAKAAGIDHTTSTPPSTRRPDRQAGYVQAHRAPPTRGRATPDLSRAGAALSTPTSTGPARKPAIARARRSIRQNPSVASG